MVQPRLPVWRKYINTHSRHKIAVASTFGVLTIMNRGIFFFTGPLLLTLTTIFEWIMGNFFPMMVCGLFAVFWLSFGMLQLPTLAIAASYSTSGDASAGALSVGYNAGIALYLMSLGFAMFSFFIFTLKTNLVFAMIFALVTAAVFVLASAYFHVAMGAYEMAIQLQHVSLSHVLSLVSQLFLFGLRH